MNSPTVAAVSSQDQDHLRLLSIFHFIVAGITALCSLFPTIYLALGIGLITGTLDNSEPDAMVAGWFFVVFGGVFILAGLTLAGFLVYAGRCLQRRRRYTLCLVVAAISCVFMPFGTVLGVFTLIVLTRSSVKTLFNAA